MVTKTLLASMIALSVTGHAATTPDALAKKVSEAPSASPESTTFSIKNVVGILNNINENYKPSNCVEKTFKKNSYKFATTYNEAGAPCKVYDLSFMTITTPTKVTALPLQEFTADDYAAWLNGDKQFVYDRIQNFKSTFGISQFAGTWAAKLDFKNKSTNHLDSFTLDDLNVDQAFTSTYPEKDEVLKALQLAGIDDADPLYAIANDPRSILSKIKINWNDLEKIYEVFIDFDFLPIKGPVHLVDYNRPYDMAANSIIRSLVFKVLNTLSGAIPEPTTQKIVKVVLNDVSEFLDLTYKLHLNALEDTLRLNIDGKVATSIPQAEAKRALNLVHASKSSLLTQYLTSLISGQTFDIMKMEEIGNQARFQTEKQRNSTSANLNSNLYWNNGCDMSQIHSYYGLCKKEGQNFGLYSLLSERKVLFWSLGASPIYYFKSPAAVPLIRYTSWLLSLGARIAPLPINSLITNQLVSILKSFATTGIDDEAYLLNYYTELKYSNNAPDAMGVQIMPYLYAQNIVPWMPKTEKWENAVINGNGELLKKLVK